MTRQLAVEYKRATKKQKGSILDMLTELSGYNRSYAARVLRQRARYVVVGRSVVKGTKVTLVEDERTKRKKKKRKREGTYDKDVLAALKKVWMICDGICGKRLAPFLAEIVPVLERWGELTLDKETRRKLIGISPATIDRMLAPARKRYQLRARSQTKPGTLLKHQIPIRTFSDWDELRPGFVEIDLVSHEGGNARGDYAFTLDATDVCTGWTETEAVRNKAERWVFAGLQKTKARFPFDIIGIDSDNGSEFINNHLFRYCTKNKITFTRSRPYRKNDNCFVEQKNYSIVRRAVSYRRYDTSDDLEALNVLYAVLRLYTNFFQPSTKLIEKTRIGSKVCKKYDRAKTPYRRVLESDTVPDEAKENLKQIYATLNPAKLNREMNRLQDRLDAVVPSKHKAEQNVNLEYIST
ncbi:transposase family protein [Candidatus Bipolaricaulota bacterium]|nr:transposase family protein [Candidatus Bipolaricaulota bacterium]